MSGIVGAKAISAVANGDIEERLHARTFVVRGKTGTTHVVTIGALEPGKTVCTCKAGQSGQRCYAVGAAQLLIAREREAATA